MQQIELDEEAIVTPLRNEYTEISTMIQTATTPILTKMQQLDDKIDKLNVVFVPRDSYEPRHLALIERDSQLESAIRDLQKEMREDFKSWLDNYQQTLQRIHERLESGKQQLEDRMKQQDQQLEEWKKAQDDKQSQAQYQRWVQIGALAGFLGAVVAMLELLLSHVHLN